MAISDILVCFDPSSAGEVRLQLAMKLAQKGKAYLVAGYALPERHDPAAAGLVGLPVIPGDGMIGVAANELTHGVNPASRAALEPPPEAALEEAAEQQFRRELAQYGIEGEWHAFAPGDTDMAVELAKSVDLVIAGQRQPDAAAGYAAWLRPASIVVAAGRPVLVVPYAGVFESVGKHVLVAWDGTREAVRALNDALPLLAGAEEVTVLFVGSREAGLEQQKLSLARILRHLEHHAIKARVEETLRGDMAVAEVLLSRAADLGADLIVAGAYHHSQLREALVGGVSRALLDHMTIPVLLSH